MRMFSTPEGDAGFALKGDDIVSVFKHPKAPYRNVTRSMLDLATSQGGRRLDAFDTVLPDIYSQSGFRAVSRLPFNDEYAPEGWDREVFKAHNGGRPDVVHMVHDLQAGAYSPLDGQPITDYDQGEQLQRQALAQIDARGNVPTAPGPEAYGSGQLIRTAAPISVHHGTPHQYEPTRANPLGEFMLKKIGTGEGAQMFGHGIYQAGNEKVAQRYRDDLSAGATYQGKVPKFDRMDPRSLAIHGVAEMMDEENISAAAAIERLERSYQTTAGLARLTGSPADLRTAQRYIQAYVVLQQLNPDDFRKTEGSLYESELHVHPEHLLDWDRPLTEQSDYVRNQLANAGMEEEESGHRTGEQVHRLASVNVFGDNDPVHGARTLLKIGIPGIRYADHNSRQHLEEARRLEGRILMMHAMGADPKDIEKERAYHQQAMSKVSHNYVVFDPRTLHIVRRNGLPAMVEAGADALRDHKAGVP